MDNKWYYEDHGRAQGPITTRELLNKLQKGNLTLLDLVFKEGQGQWMPLETFSEITELMGTNANLQKDSDWIILRAVEVDGKEKFEQIGPFAVDHVMELIDRGKIKFSDFVWRTGFDNWVPLGKLDKFDKPLASSVEIDLSLYKIPDHRIIESTPAPAPVRNYNPVSKPMPRSESAPAEAKGQDLAAAQWAELEKQQRELAAREAAVKETAAREAAAEVMRKELEAKEKELRLRQEKEREMREAAARAAEEQRRKVEQEHRERERLAAEQKAKQLEKIELEKKKQTELEKRLAAIQSRENDKAAQEKKAREEAEMARQREREEKRLQQEMAFRERIRREQEEKDRQLRARGAKASEQQLNAPPKPASTETQPSIKSPLPPVNTVAAVVTPPPPPVAEKISATPLAMAVTSTLEKPAAVIKEQKSEEKVIVEPTPEALEKLRKRWQNVLVAVGCLAVVFGFSLFGMWGKKRFMKDGEPNIVFERTETLPEGVIEPIETTASQPTAALPAPEEAPLPASVQQASSAPAPLGAAPSATQAVPLPTGGPAVSEGPAPASVTENAVEPTAMNVAGGFKQKAYFYHQERQYLFYNARKGATLTAELNNMMKYTKNPVAWKRNYEPWAAKVKVHLSATTKEMGKPKVYPQLYKKLRMALVQLDARGRELNVQATQNRGPTKATTVSDVASEFKRIRDQAKNLE